MSETHRRYMTVPKPKRVLLSTAMLLSLSFGITPAWATSKAKCSVHHATSALHPRRAGSLKTSAEMSIARAAKQYLTDVAPANAVLKSFATKAARWGRHTKKKTAAAEARPTIFAISTLERKLLAQRWPSSAGVDLRALAHSCGAIVRDLKSLAKVNALGSTNWMATFQHHASTLGTDARAVRRDLGLSK